MFFSASSVGGFIKSIIFIGLVVILGGGCFYLWKQNNKLSMMVGELKAEKIYCETQLQLLGMSSFEFRAYMEERCHDLEKFYRDLPERPDDGVLDSELNAREEGSGSDAPTSGENTATTKRGAEKGDSGGGNWLQRVKTWFEGGAGS